MLCLNVLILLPGLLAASVDKEEFTADLSGDSQKKPEPLEEDLIEQNKEAFSILEESKIRQPRQSVFTSFTPQSGSVQPGFSFQTILRGPDASGTVPSGPPRSQSSLRSGNSIQSGQSLFNREDFSQISAVAPIPQPSPRLRPTPSIDNTAFQGFRFDRVFAPNTREEIVEEQSRLKSFENFQNFRNIQNNNSPKTSRTQSNINNIKRARTTQSSLEVSKFPTFTQVTSLTPSPVTSLPTRPPRPPNADPRKRPTIENDKFKTLKEEVKSSLEKNKLDQPKSESKKRQRNKNKQTIAKNKVETSSLQEDNSLSSLKVQVQDIEGKQNSALEKSKREQKSLFKCKSSNKEYKTEIEELENRTRLHIEYAKEKQIEIILLEKGYEVFKNESEQDKSTIKRLERSLIDINTLVEVKESNITDLTNEMFLLDESFKKEMQRNHKEIKSLTQKFSSTVIELETKKQLLIAEEAKNRKVIGDLDKSKKKIKKLKQDKKNLLQIVQQLAEIGNPALNFMSEFFIDEDEDSNDKSAENEANLESEFLEDISSLEIEGSADGLEVQ